MKQISIGEQTFPSVSKMCSYFGVKRVTYESRKASGKSDLEAVTTSVRGRSKKVIDMKVDNKKSSSNNEPRYRPNEALVVENMQFDSANKACVHYKLDFDVYTSRLKAGLCPELALTIPHHEVEILGTKFHDVVEACEYCEVNIDKYLYNIKHGMEPEQAIVTEVMTQVTDTETLNKKAETNMNKTRTSNAIIARKKSIIIKTPEGTEETYPSIKAACDHYDVTVSTFYSRRLKMSDYEALTYEPSPAIIAGQKKRLDTLAKAKEPMKVSKSKANKNSKVRTQDVIQDVVQDQPKEEVKPMKDVIDNQKLIASIRITMSLLESKIDNLVINSDLDAIHREMLKAKLEALEAVRAAAADDSYLSLSLMGR